MAGDAKTTQFVLSAATVMIGPVADVFNLNPAAHSIGLVKNFAVTAEPTYTDLTQGVRNSIVFSVLTDNPVRANMEVYEYTAKNLKYGLGLDGTTIVAHTKEILDAAVAAAATTAVISIPTVDPSASYLQDDWIMMQSGDTDIVHLAKLSGDGSWVDPTLTLNFTAHAVPTGVSFAQGDPISRVHRVNVGEKTEQPFFSAKVVGILPQGNEPVTILFPKVRVTRGFNVAFSTDQFGNMPFEFTPFELVTADTHFAEFQNKGVAALFAAL